MSTKPFLSYDKLLTTTETLVRKWMEVPNDGGHALAVGAVLLFRTLGGSYAPDALAQQCKDDAERLNLLIEQLRSAPTK